MIVQASYDGPPYSSTPSMSVSMTPSLNGLGCGGCQRNAMAAHGQALQGVLGLSNMKLGLSVAALLAGVFAASHFKIGRRIRRALKR